jgi:hypothetical protein
MITDPKPDLFRATRVLESLEIRHAFTGGAVTPTYLDLPQLVEFRPTKDLDVVV